MIATGTDAWISFMLMVSKVTLAPLIFSHSEPLLVSITLPVACQKSFTVSILFRHVIFREGLLSLAVSPLATIPPPPSRLHTPGGDTCRVCHRKRLPLAQSLSSFIEERMIVQVTDAVAMESKRRDSDAHRTHDGM